MSMIAVHHFALNQLWIDAELLGTSHERIFRGHTCRLVFPTKLRDFGLEMANPPVSMNSIGGYAEQDGEWVKAAIKMVRVEVLLEADLMASEFPEGGDGDPQRLALANDLIRASADVAGEFIGTLTPWARVEAGQWWLTPTQTSPPELTWLSALFDGTGARLPVGHGAGLNSLWMFSDREQAVDSAMLHRALDRVEQEAEPPTAELLLADAYFFAWRATHPNPHLGLMLAAIATESKVKQTLYELAEGGQKPLVLLITSSPRDVTVSAVALLDKAMQAIGRRSLRDADKELFKAVDRLFQHRNAFAHRGATDLDGDAIRTDLNAARDVFEWLDRIRRETGDVINSA